MMREFIRQKIWLSQTKSKHFGARYATTSELNRPEPLAGLPQSAAVGRPTLVALPLGRS